MFTRIIHPKTGEEIQIKTGDDFLNTYRIGDKVERYINPNYFDSGCCFDGCYYGHGNNKDYLVIIKNEIVSDIIDTDEENFPDLYKKYSELNPYKIPYSEYTLKAIVKHFISEIKWKLIHLKERYKNNKFHKELIKEYGKDEGDKRFMGYIFAKPLRQKLDYGGMCSKFVTVDEWDDSEELPSGTPIIFDKK